MEAANSKRRRCEPPDVDRLSALSDALLLHTLSFLDMKDVVKTALLSRRWRHLWTSTRSLDFFGKGGRWPCDYLVSPDFVDWALILHQGAKIRTFCAAPRCSRGAVGGHEICQLVRRIDSWVHFALRRGVEELDLDCVDVAHCDTSTAEYTVPRRIFTSQSLVSLALRFCRLRPPPGILMCSLKILTLYCIDIDDPNLEVLLAGCPSLEYLTLQHCNRKIGLGIHAGKANSRLKTLNICDFNIPNGDFDDGVAISAPSITTLVLAGDLRDYYTIVDLSSIVSASLDVGFMCYWEVGLDDFQCLADLLCDLRHVQALRLSSWCVQVLSVRPSEPSRLSSDFSVVSLELDISFLTCEFPGIFNALRKFTKLEFLTVHGICGSQKIKFVSGISKRSFVDKRRYVLSNERPSPTMLKHLRTVTIFGLVRAICAERKRRLVEKKCQNGIEFIRFLLENSPVLGKLTIITTVNEKLTKRNYEILFRFASSLLNLRRASPNVLVIIEDA